MEIGNLQSLAKLPRAGLGGHGRPKLCQVHGIQAGHIRKRNEVCAAIDANSVNIYEVRNGRNLASWPVPPDSTFVCTPSSKRLKLDDGTCERRSWCVIRRQGELQAQCYTERKDKAGLQHRTSGSSLAYQASTVSSIQPTPDGTQVLLTHEDGTLSAHSIDATTELAHTILSACNTRIRIYTIDYMSMVTARASVLKSRLDLGLGLADHTIIIPMIYEYIKADDKSTGNLYYAVWAWTTQSQSEAFQLMEHDLGVKPHSRNCDLSFKSISSTYTLDLVNDGLEITIDLTKVVPYMSKKVKKLSQGASTFVDISPDIRMYATANELQLHNRKFSSLLASKEHDRQADSSRSKHADLRLLNYFPHLNRVLGYTKTHLISIDLHSSQDMDLNLKQESRLVGSVVRGANTRSTTGNENVSLSIGRPLKRVSPSGWKNTSVDLRALIDRNDIEGFEDILLTSIEHDLGGNALSSAPVEFALSSMFQISAVNTTQFDHIPRLELRFFAPRLLKWCIQNGFLTDQAVHRALASQQQRISWLPLGSVADSLFKDDTTLDVVEYYILRSPYLEPRVLATLIKAMIGKVLAAVLSESSIAQDAQMTEIGEETNALVVAKSNLRMKAQGCLGHTLHLLSLAGPAAVTRQFHQTLSHNQILALIQFLRQQLFRGGFTRRPDSDLYPTPPASTSGEVNDSHPELTTQLSLTSIITLLNGCIDTLGPLGILDSNTDPTQTRFLESLLPDLLSEIHSAIDAIQESADLQGTLRETLRYVQSVQKQQQNTRKDHSTRQASENIRPGEITVVYTEPEVDEEMGIEQAALPISLRAREDIDRYKVRKGGGQVSRRSKREIGMLIDRTRSAYSLERLVF